MPDLKPIVEDGATYLVTVDEWFYASDGQAYRAAWGPCFLRRVEDVLGFRPSRSTNWFLQVGEGDGALILAGCQIHFLQRTDEAPAELIRTNPDERADYSPIFVVDRPGVAAS